MHLRILVLARSEQKVTLLRSRLSCIFKRNVTIQLMKSFHNCFKTAKRDCNPHWLFLMCVLSFLSHVALLKWYKMLCWKWKSINWSKRPSNNSNQESKSWKFQEWLPSHFVFSSSAPSSTKEILPVGWLCDPTLNSWKNCQGILNQIVLMLKIISKLCKNGSDKA